MHILVLALFAHRWCCSMYSCYTTYYCITRWHDHYLCFIPLPTILLSCVHLHGVFTLAALIPFLIWEFKKVDVCFVAQVVFMHHPQSLYVGQNSHYFHSEPVPSSYDVISSCNYYIASKGCKYVFLLGWGPSSWNFPLQPTLDLRCHLACYCESSFPTPPPMFVGLLWQALHYHYHHVFQPRHQNQAHVFPARHYSPPLDM